MVLYNIIRKKIYNLIQRIKFKIGSKVFISTHDLRSESENGVYIKTVQKTLANYNAFKKFKQNPNYRLILEHASYLQGLEYLEIVKKQSPNFLSKLESIKRNDLIGKPELFSYSKVGLISPSTLRYLKVASDLTTIFGEIENLNVAEIGVGYGGQCLVSDSIQNILTYDLFDMPPVLGLVEKYLECHLLKLSYRTLTLNQSDGLKQYDIAISNYAFSELPSKVQRMYIKKVFSQAKRGYLTMNSGIQESCYRQDKLAQQELADLLPNIKILKEDPQTFKGNYIIVWGKA